MTTCGAAIKNFEAKTGEVAAEAKIVKLYCQVPPIAKMDGSLNNLTACEHLQLSTNAIDKFGVALSLPNLKILSVGRNVIKKFDKLDDLGDNLEEPWCSYNQIQSLDGLSNLTNLQVLYMSNNQLKNFDELSKLSANPGLRDILLVGNPMYEGLEPTDAKIEVLRRLPNLAKIDGAMVLQSERDAAAAPPEE